MNEVLLKSASCFTNTASFLTSAIVSVFAKTVIPYLPSMEKVIYGDHDPVHKLDLEAGKVYVADRTLMTAPIGEIERSVYLITNVYHKTGRYRRGNDRMAAVINCENGIPETICCDDYTFYQYDEDLGPVIICMELAELQPPAVEKISKI
ncbi:MAG: hypothetical protein HUJ54_11215 [Erysipelotrichaceae bacterium]|nr:hypothetical protein [Erysipelotrichaceae bacterium]